MNLDAALQRLWYGPAWRTLPLWPLAALYGGATAVRSASYRLGLLRAQHPSIPVVVVGNVTVGGTGKTPVAAWLARELARHGHRVGVVLRGYGGRTRGTTIRVTTDSDPAQVGDEAILHAQRGAHVVVVGADRVAAARQAAAEGAEVVVCDDGLQHLRLARDCEIAVVDARRALGNGWLLPAGPLREPARRLSRVDALVLTQRGDPVVPRLAAHAPLAVSAALRLGEAVNLRSGERRPLTAFRGPRLHALAAIGHPEAFFAALRGAGLEIRAHALPDHATPDRDDLPFATDETVLMTEKDAVKCRPFAGPDWWFVELDVVVDAAAAESLVGLVLERTGLAGAGVDLG